MSVARVDTAAAWFGERLAAFVAFSRPHTIIGTGLSVTGLYVIAAQEAVAPSRLALAATLSCALAANLYIVGLNQLTDIPVDRLNKPYLPLAAGALRPGTAMAWVTLALIVALAIAASQGPFLLTAIVMGVVIGTAYSVQPLRLKRHPGWAGASISAVRGLVVNLLVFLHFTTYFGGPASVPPKIWVLTLMILGLSLAIAWFKDIPDMTGDRRFDIITLTLRLGAPRVIALGRGLLSLCFVAVILAGLLGLPGVNGTVLAVSQVLLLAVLWIASRRLDLGSPLSVRAFYLTVWGLFFAEYVAFPVACLLG